MVDRYFMPTGSRLLRTHADEHRSVLLSWVEMRWVGLSCVVSVDMHSALVKVSSSGLMWELYTLHSRPMCCIDQTWGIAPPNLLMVPRCRRGKGGVLWRSSGVVRSVCSVTAYLESCLPPIVLHVPSANSVPSMQAVDFFQQLHRLGREHHEAVAAGRRRWPFVPRPLWLVLSCRAHPKLTPSLESIKRTQLLHSLVRHSRWCKN